ncbi:hypothetical protein, partial [Mesorhizobium sp. M2D.F.Ca.ET.140.01.1.1]|uniref:hypothetical protein n=1 Tax=Mesorhizobium sp. M2D.F.Ca.ET.140.01.1.1 TaxID=2496664 RepID=UPI001AED0F90
FDHHRRAGKKSRMMKKTIFDRRKKSDIPSARDWDRGRWARMRTEMTRWVLYRLVSTSGAPKRI